jgi:hypothetical protein
MHVDLQDNKTPPTANDHRREEYADSSFNE